MKRAVEDATLINSIFVALSYHNANIEIETIQIKGKEDMYRLGVLPSEASDDSGKIDVNDGITYKET